MNIWERQISEIILVAPKRIGYPTSIDLDFNSESIYFIAVPSLVLIGFKNRLRAIFNLPMILFTIFCAMRKADHIHLRCPGNMGLLGAFVQILFPKKNKTAKYAGNWDWNSEQPWSYRLQQRILRNTFFTRNMKVLVYGNWNETKNILPFYTATYSKREILTTPVRNLSRIQPLKLIFVGTLHEGKRPQLCLEVLVYLKKAGVLCEFHFYGEGPERDVMEKFIERNALSGLAFFHGNVNSETLKSAYQKSHFLIFISKSEGWPKVVAESMFWGCLPLTSSVSCVSEMVGNGLRGDIIEPNALEIANRINYYLDNPHDYSDKCQKSMDWSRIYTLEKFEKDIKHLVL
jgi:glycosyltransferase involved in cell wall biosynthesis